MPEVGRCKVGGNLVGSYWSQTATTNYGVVNHHCYIKLELSAADLSLPREKMKFATYLYDGHTDELLASFEVKGMSEKGGMVYDQYWGQQPRFRRCSELHQQDDGDEALKLGRSASLGAVGARLSSPLRWQARSARLV